MESSSTVEEVRLCDGCLSLRLDIRLLLQDPGKDPSKRTSITLSPDRCSLCSLISRLLRKRRLAGEIPISERDLKAVETFVTETAKRKAGAERSEMVRRFDVVWASAPRNTILRFWPCLYPVPRLHHLCDTNENLALPFPSGRLIEPLADIRLF